MNTATQDILKSMDRNSIVVILESHGYACFDEDTTRDLREKLTTDITELTIPENELPQSILAA